MKNHLESFFFLIFKNLFKNVDFTLWNIFKCLEYLNFFFEIGCHLEQIKVCGSYFISLMLYQENECLAHLTVHFPNPEISKQVKKHRNVMGIFNLGIVSQISENRG